MGLWDTIKNGFSNAWNTTKNWLGKQVNDFRTDPIGKMKSIGNGLANIVGKASGIISGFKKASDFVRNIPVIGDIASNTPGLSNVMNGIDTADKYASKVNGYVQGGNNLVQRLPSQR
jgi:phage-related protein